MSVGTRHRAPSAGVGASVARPDGRAKVDGEFAFVADLHDDRMLWGATLRKKSTSAVKHMAPSMRRRHRWKRNACS